MILRWSWGLCSWRLRWFRNSGRRHHGEKVDQEFGQLIHVIRLDQNDLHTWSNYK
jgi:hypothetical protein